MRTFSKRSFTARSLIDSLSVMLRYFPWLIWAYLLRGIKAGMAERLFLMISTVNDCRYCRWFHTRMALKHDVPVEEVELLLKYMIPQGIKRQEYAALLFAIHYAESSGQVLPAALDDLAQHYPQREIKGILALSSAIYFGNLCGNTFDAFLSRLKGQAAEGSSVLVESLVFIICAPLLLPLISRVKMPDYPAR